MATRGEELQHADAGVLRDLDLEIDPRGPLLDPSDLADPLVDALLRGPDAARDVADEAMMTVARSTARLWSSLADALRRARDEPWEWVPVAPGTTSPSARESAERAAAADLAFRLRLAEGTVRSWAHLADTAQRRLPRLWLAFSTGLVSAAHIRAALEALQGLDDEACRRIDAELADDAGRLGLSRFRARARRAASRHRIDETARLRAAVDRRGVWIESVGDGTAWITAHVAEEAAARVRVRLDADARQAASDPGETRTRDQLRADLLCAALTGDGTPRAVGVQVSVTVPVTTLLGVDDRPASLDGVVPVDPETARRWCREAPSLVRILTDPVESTILAVDRRSYRPPADLARLVRLRDGTCTAPGCPRPASGCDLDHIRAWADGGETCADNLTALCRHHHRLKHMTGWTVTGSAGATMWHSPSGASFASDHLGARAGTRRTDRVGADTDPP